MKETTPAAMPPCFEKWCKRFDDVFTHKAQKREFRHYLGGLLGESERKNLFQMAEDAIGVTYHRLHHFLTEAPWSGLKINERHTLKSQMIGMPEGKDIVEVEVGVPGPTADIKLFRQSQNKFDKSQPFSGDKGFQGGENITTPHKRKPKRELTQQQKDENKALSSNRIFIEHLIRLLKIFRIASQRFRLKLDTYEQIILTVCGLVRLRIGSFILPP
ncbi:MAG: transposase family protein [Nostoc sp.]